LQASKYTGIYFKVADSTVVAVSTISLELSTIPLGGRELDGDEVSSSFCFLIEVESVAARIGLFFFFGGKGLISTASKHQSGNWYLLC